MEDTMGVTNSLHALFQKPARSQEQRLRKLLFVLVFHLLFGLPTLAASHFRGGEVTSHAGAGRHVPQPMYKQALEESLFRENEGQRRLAGTPEASPLPSSNGTVPSNPSPAPAPLPKPTTHNSPSMVTQPPPPSSPAPASPTPAPSPAPAPTTLPPPKTPAPTPSEHESGTPPPSPTPQPTPPSQPTPAPTPPHDSPQDGTEQEEEEGEPPIDGGNSTEPVEDGEDNHLPFNYTMMAQVAVQVPEEAIVEGQEAASAPSMTAPQTLLGAPDVAVPILQSAIAALTAGGGGQGAVLEGTTGGAERQTSMSSGSGERSDARPAAGRQKGGGPGERVEEGATIDASTSTSLNNISEELRSNPATIAPEDQTPSGEKKILNVTVVLGAIAGFTVVIAAAMLTVYFRHSASQKGQAGDIAASPDERGSSDILTSLAPRYSNYEDFSDAVLEEEDYDEDEDEEMAKEPHHLVISQSHQSTRESLEV